jgi:hypothetical protein
MYTAGALILLALLGWYVNRANEKDRRDYDRARSTDDRHQQLLLHIRQDVKLIAFLLMGLIVMLAAVADGLHFFR